MPRFIIKGDVTRTSQFIVEVEADDEDEAREIAEGDAQDGIHPHWTDNVEVDVYEVTRVAEDWQSGEQDAESQS